MKHTCSNAQTVAKTRGAPVRQGLGTTPSASGKVRPAILLWALGTPLSLVLLFVVIRGCVG